MSPARSPDQTAPDASMKSEGLAKQILITFALTALLYLIIFQTIEYRRNRNGPWQVTFTNSPGNPPALIINQPKLGLTNVQLIFTDVAMTTNVAETLVLNQPRRVPWDVPFGQCIFLDLVSMPGAAVFECFGHQIQLLPRVLTVDHREIAWESVRVITLTQTNRVEEGSSQLR